MISFAILEDTPSDAETLNCFIDKAFSSFPEPISVSVFRNAIDFLEKGIQCDVVFFDIQLPGMNGLEAAKKFRERNREALIIFVTNLGQFALKGYEVNAFDFVVKPIVYEDFLLKARRIGDALNGRKKGPKLSIKTPEGTRFCSSSDVMFIEAINHDLTFNLESKKQLTTRGRLRDYETELQPYGFCLCNRCYLINLRFLTAIEDDVAVVMGNRLLIARKRKKALLAAMNEYLSRS